MRLSLYFASVLALSAAAWSCATGTDPIEGELPPFLDEPDTGPVELQDSGRSNTDGGSHYGTDGSTREGGARPDSGSSDASTVDTGTTVDSGNDGGTTTGRTDLCTGSVSQQLSPSTYDDLCDNYYFNTFGQGKPCGATGASCASYAGSDGIAQYCCFISPPGSFCRLDYGNTPQCLPK